MEQEPLKIGGKLQNRIHSVALTLFALSCLGMILSIILIAITVIFSIQSLQIYFLGFCFLDFGGFLLSSIVLLIDHGLTDGARIGRGASRTENRTDERKKAIEHFRNLARPLLKRLAAQEVRILDLAKGIQKRVESSYRRQALPDLEKTPLRELLEYSKQLPPDEAELFRLYQQECKKREDARTALENLAWERRRALKKLEADPYNDSGDEVDSQLIKMDVAAGGF